MGQTMVEFQPERTSRLWQICTHWDLSGVIWVNKSFAGNFQNVFQINLTQFSHDGALSCIKYSIFFWNVSRCKWSPSCSTQSFPVDDSFSLTRGLSLLHVKQMTPLWNHYQPTKCLDDNLVLWFCEVCATVLEIANDVVH